MATKAERVLEESSGMMLHTGIRKALSSDWSSLMYNSINILPDWAWSIFVVYFFTDVEAGITPAAEIQKRFRNFEHIHVWDWIQEQSQQKRNKFEKAFREKNSEINIFMIACRMMPREDAEYLDGWFKDCVQHDDDES